MWKKPPGRCQLFFFHSMLFPPADMNATTATPSRGVKARLGVPLQRDGFCCIGVAVKTPPTASQHGHFEQRGFSWVLFRPQNLIFSSVLSWSVRVNAKTHPHWHLFLSFGWSRTLILQPPKPCLFISEWPHRCYLGYCVWHAVASLSQSLNIQYRLF